jgi:NAD(P) transhydrogenase subunit alpha
MAFTNAISGISLVASIVIAGGRSDTLLVPILGAVAVASATINVVGGFLITDRMLRMFKRKGAGK